MSQLATKRLSLEDFKANVELNNVDHELEKLTGGVLASCHVESHWYDGVVSWFNTCAAASTQRAIDRNGIR